MSAGHRWCEARAALAAAGASRDLIERARRVGAADRQRIRVEDTRRAALAAADGSSARAALLLAADLLGLGGPGGCGSTRPHEAPVRTIRLPVFSGLGSGRRHAADGGAWMAAAAAALRGLLVDDIHVGPEDVEVLLDGPLPVEWAIPFALRACEALARRKVRVLLREDPILSIGVRGVLGDWVWLAQDLLDRLEAIQETSKAAQLRAAAEEEVAP